MHGEGTIKGDQHGAQRAAAIGVLEPAATGSDELQTRRIHQVQRRILVVLVLTQILGGAGRESASAWRSPRCPRLGSRARMSWADWR